MSPGHIYPCRCRTDSRTRQRKELGHSQLITEVINQLVGRFKPEIPMVKKRIEDLITREYLERAEEYATPTYRYLA